MYSVEVVEEAAEQIAALPTEVLPDLARLVDLLELDPSAGDPYHRSKPDGTMRAFTFGPGGHGLLVALVDERGRRVLVLKVVWLG